MGNKTKTSAQTSAQIAGLLLQSALDRLQTEDDMEKRNQYLNQYLVWTHPTVNQYNWLITQYERENSRQNTMPNHPKIEIEGKEVGCWTYSGQYIAYSLSEEFVCSHPIATNLPVDPVVQQHAKKHVGEVVAYTLVNEAAHMEEHRARIIKFTPNTILLQTEENDPWSGKVRFSEKWYALVDIATVRPVIQEDVA